MNQKYDELGRPKTNTVQMITSVTSIVNNSLDISSNLEPQYMEESDRPVHIFKDNDFLTYRKFDPKAYHEYKNSKPDNTTQRNADKLNPVVAQ